MTRVNLRTLAALGLAAVTQPLWALQPLPEEPGFDGFINLGVAAGEIETNFIAEIDDLGIDLGDERLDDFGAPDGESLVMPVMGFELGYTLDNRRTRFSIGNDFIDYLEFIRTTAVGVRHDFDRYGSVKLEALVAPGIATQVYADPYQLDVDRDTTDIEDSGVRLTWDRIWGTDLELIITALERDIDDELSGQALGLSAGDRDLLDRNGDIFAVSLGYSFRINERNRIRPALTYVDKDLDGDAMAQQGAIASLEHTHTGDSIVWRNRVAYGSLDGDEENPLFEETSDADRVTVSTLALFPGIFGLEHWTGSVGVTYSDADNDVDFNDSSIVLFSASMMRRF